MFEGLINFPLLLWSFVLFMVDTFYGHLYPNLLNNQANGRQLYFTIFICFCVFVSNLPRYAVSFQHFTDLRWITFFKLILKLVKPYERWPVSVLKMCLLLWSRWGKNLLAVCQCFLSIMALQPGYTCTGTSQGVCLWWSNSWLQE